MRFGTVRPSLRHHVRSITQRYKTSDRLPLHNQQQRQTFQLQEGQAKIDTMAEEEEDRI